MNSKKLKLKLKWKLENLGKKTITRIEISASEKLKTKIVVIAGEKVKIKINLENKIFKKTRTKTKM